MKLVILDRDGVINEDSDDYIKSVDEWHPIPGSLDAIVRLSQAGYRVFLATNQSAVGRGYIDFDGLFAIHDRLQRLLAELGGRVDGIEFAPEHPDEATDMRKPNPGMLKDIARRLQIKLDNVYFVGDSLGDIQAAHGAGARPVLVRTGSGRCTEKKPGAEGVPVYDSLADFVGALLAA
jgi:D-glycero-D-manno-heptose 1,7-bisphosphate phosphatase